MRGSFTQEDPSWTDGPELKRGYQGTGINVDLPMRWRRRLARRVAVEKSQHLLWRGGIQAAARADKLAVFRSRTKAPRERNAVFDSLLPIL